MRHKYFELIKFFADTGELDRVMRDLSHRQRRPAAGVTIKLGQDDAGDLERVIKMSGHADRLLTRSGVSHKQNFLGLEKLFYALELFHERLIDFLPAGRVKDQNVRLCPIDSGFLPFQR